MSPKPASKSASVGQQFNRLLSPNLQKQNPILQMTAKSRPVLQLTAYPNRAVKGAKNVRLAGNGGTPKKA